MTWRRLGLGESISLGGPMVGDDGLTLLPFPVPGNATELLWSASDDDDPATELLRRKIVAIAKGVTRGRG